MGEIFLTSDTHFAHQPMFLWEPRGFQSVEEMNEAIIERWNKVVKPDDTVIHLGDIMLTNNKIGLECLKSLNGTINIIWGNHDSPSRQMLIHTECPNIITLGYAHMFKYGKYSIYLSHYPTLTANYDDKHFSQHVINMHGHTHQQKNWLQPDNPFMYHVGMDSHNCTPVHIDEAITDIRNRWNEMQKFGVPMKELYNYPL